MTAAVATRPAPLRRIEQVPSLVLGLLEAAGKLPKRYGACDPRRTPTLQEAAALTYLVDWDLRHEPVAGLRPALAYAAFRDVYDYHDGKDVREVVILMGTARSVIRLLKAMQADAHAVGRALIGVIDDTNAAMKKALLKLGAVERRVTIEEVHG